jgi:hypothetical protein
MERVIGRLRTEARAGQKQYETENFAATIVTRIVGDATVAPVAGVSFPATRAWLWLLLPLTQPSLNPAC